MNTNNNVNFDGVYEHNLLYYTYACIDKYISDDFKHFGMVFSIMYNTPFKVIHPEDMFEEEYILEFRKYLYDLLDCDIDNLHVTRPVNFLEVIISIAYKWNDYYDEYYDKDLIGSYILEMVDNLCLIKSNRLSYGQIKEIINRCNDRNYDKNGIGSLFPIYKNSKINQKNNSIWQQLNAYLINQKRYN